MLRGLAAEACEQIGRVRYLETPAFREPQGRREVVEGDDRLKAMLAAGLEHIRIMIELGVREMAFAGLDPRPFDTEAIAIEAELCRDGDVFGVTMIGIACVAGAILIHRGLQVLAQP